MFKSAVTPVIEKAIQMGNIVGSSVVIAQHGKIVFENHSGYADREAGKLVNEKTIFRLASMTKPIVSATALALVEKGVIALDTPVTHWLPFFTPKSPDGNIVPITIRHLLTHTSGLAYGFLMQNNEPYHSAGISDGIDETVLSLEENLTRLVRQPLLFTPGKGWCYSIGTDVLGAVIEKATGKSLPEIVAEYVTQPLSMRDTTFLVKDVEHLSNAYADNSVSGGIPRLMKDHDEVLLPGCGHIRYAPGRITNIHAYPSGGAGMAATAHDYLKFLETIRQHGETILKPDSVQLMVNDATQGIGASGPGMGFGLGFAIVRDSKAAGTPRHAGSFDWGGVYGTKMFVDPTSSLTAVILTNTALGGWGFADQIINAIYSTLPKA